MKNVFLAGMIVFFAIPAIAQTNQFIITNYGAVADGKTVATKALQTAIDDCNNRHLFTRPGFTGKYQLFQYLYRDKTTHRRLVGQWRTHPYLRCKRNRKRQAGADKACTVQQYYLQRRKRNAGVG